MSVNACDVLVVGLGPAGARAAEAAAAAGLHVVALERKKRPGSPVQCAEFVPAMMDQEVDGLDAVTVQTVERMDTYVEEEPVDQTPDFPGRMIDRARFDAMLAERAARAGADCRYGVSVRWVGEDGSVVMADGSVWRSRLLIGADGPRSAVGAAIGADNTEIVETRQIAVPLLRPHRATDIFLRRSLPGGYGWLFPRGEAANVGLGVRQAARDRLKPLLDGLRLELMRAGRIGDGVFAHTGGAIPVGGMTAGHGRLERVPVLLAGDAAGLTNPVTGAGINAAVQSGRLAGRAAADWLEGDGSAPEDYAEELEDLFAASLARAVRRRRQVLACYDVGGGPTPVDLRHGWIAYDAYWANDARSGAAAMAAPAMTMQG